MRCLPKSLLGKWLKRWLKWPCLCLVTLVLGHIWLDHSDAWLYETRHQIFISKVWIKRLQSCSQDVVGHWSYKVSWKWGHSHCHWKPLLEASQGHGEKNPRDAKEAQSKRGKRRRLRGEANLETSGLLILSRCSASWPRKSVKYSSTP